MKMNIETTVTEVIPTQASQNATTITITLHPQPNLDVVCDSEEVTGKSTLTNMSPTSSDTDSLHQTQMMVKRSLKLDLTKHDDDNLEMVKSFDSISPSNDALVKSPKSPMSPRNGKTF